MSESLGSVLVIRIFLVFLILYIIFIAVTFNFLKAYKTKNYIVEHIEKENGEYSTDVIQEHMKEIGMIAPEVTAKQMNNTYSNCTENGENTCVAATGGQNYPYRIYKRSVGTDCYYEVEVYATIKIVPVFDLDYTATIKGETKKVTNCS